MRAAIVGGAAYHAGKHVQGNRDAEAQYAAEAAAPPEETGISSDTIARLAQLADLHTKGILTDAEFEVQKAKLLEAS